MVSRECEVVLYSGRHLNDLQAIRDHIGKPIRITNQFRTPSHNEDVGGSKKSNHMKGIASDIVVDGMKASDLKLIVSKICGYYSEIITYKNTNHVHVGSDCKHKRLYHNGEKYVSVDF